MMASVEIPDKLIPKTQPEGKAMGEDIATCTVGRIECYLLAQKIIKEHPKNLAEYLGDLFYGVNRYVSTINE